MLQKKYCYKVRKTALLGLIPLLQIRKYLRCDSPQIANPKNCKINFIRRSQISKFLQNTAQLCHKTALKVVF
jgi:hypothetical protein